VKPNYSLTVAEGNISGDLISGVDVKIIHRVLHRAGMFSPKWHAKDRSDTYSASYANGRTSIKKCTTFRAYWAKLSIIFLRSK